MTRVLFPGTFDPIHFGHLDIARRAARMFDEVVVAVYDRPLKTLLFSPEERIQLVREVLQGDERISVVGYSGLTINFAKQIGAHAIVRGLRVFSDFEFEFQMALTNRKLAPDIETLFLMPNEDYSYVSSSMVREIASLGGDVEKFVPPAVAAALKTKLARK